MVATIGYVAATIPAQVIRVSNTTLFHVAVTVWDDPLQWVAIARLNKMLDPWVTPATDLLIPPVLPAGPIPPTGILGL